MLQIEKEILNTDLDFLNIIHQKVRKTEVLIKGPAGSKGGG